VEQDIRKNFLGVKGMILTGKVGPNSNGLPPILAASRILPRLRASIFWKHDPDHDATLEMCYEIQVHEESKVRPWVVPIGLDFRVISPPSNQTQYLDIGVQFGAGIEHQV